LPVESLPRRSRVFWPLAAAALVLLAVGVWLVRFAMNRGAWTVADLNGSPRLRNEVALLQEKWKPGDAIETDANSRVELQVQGLGQVEVGPNSRLTL
jgi:hypothetical protein